MAGNMPTKVLVYHPKSIEGDIDEAITAFDEALYARAGSIVPDGVFLPNMEKVTPFVPSHTEVRTETYVDSQGNTKTRKVTVTIPDVESPNRIIVNAEEQTTGLVVYKVTRPGFLYYQHWKNYWDPSGYIQILVCKSADFKSTPVYELLNTKDTSSATGGNEHPNNMFPIRPGASTYILVRGTFSQKSQKKQLFFVPAWGIGSVELALTPQADTVKLPTTVVSGNANDNNFRQIFEGKMPD